MKPPVVVDKSYAHWKSGLLVQLSRKFTLLVPTAFYYEVFDATSQDRERELKNFPDFRRVHIGSLLRLESETGTPAESLSLPELRFDSEIANQSWQPPGEVKEALEQHRQASISPALEFWNEVIRAKRVPGFSEEEMAGTAASDDEFTELCMKLRYHHRIQYIAKEIGWVHAARIMPNWIHYRHFQTLVLQGLILLRRYRNFGDSIGEPRLEHDIHDLEYLTLGLHVGRLATAETSKKISKAAMAWRFRILSPEGSLITQHS